MIEGTFDWCCEFMNVCPDIKKLGKNPDNEDLRHQYNELCNTPAPESCTKYQIFSENRQMLKQE